MATSKSALFKIGKEILKAEITGLGYLLVLVG